MPSIQQITESLDANINALRAQITSLEKARAALINGAAPATAPPASRKPARRRARQRRRSSTRQNVLLADAAVKMLADGDLGQ